MTTITLPRATVEQALAALEKYRKMMFVEAGCRFGEGDAAITNLRAALAESERDWSLLKATQASLREHMAEIRRLRAALAQQAEPVDPVAWVASKDGRVIYDDASTDDCLLRVSGDFEDDAQRARYAKQIVDKLNAAPPRCPNCASLEAQNTELDRRLAEMEQAEPVQEPVAWYFEARHIDSAWGAAVSLKHPGPEGVYMRNVKPLYTAPPKAEPVQEPVAWNWMLDGQPYGQAYYGNPPDEDIAERAAIAGRTVRLLYTAPPQRTMVPLTEDDICRATKHHGVSKYTAINIARAIEKASWEKNHG